jgi:uncharacterized protein YdeI (YjbR/CyaY-like superfamily)
MVPNPIMLRVVSAVRCVYKYLNMEVIGQNQRVDFYFNKEDRWQEEITGLRSVVLDCGLNEVLKWGCPCYTLNNRNIVLIHVFKEYCALLFFKGALLQDAKKMLIRQTPNVQAARQLRFTNMREVKSFASLIKAYVYEAMELEKSGAKVELKKTSDFPVAPEFEVSLRKNIALKKAFAALTPGRQRAYLHYFSTAKQSVTRAQRVDKCIPKIMKGQGLDD